MLFGVDKIKYNIGAGEEILDGYINCDLYPKDNRVLKVDVNKLPLPFKSNSGSLIRLSHLLEHIENPYELLRDCRRVLKPNGRLVVKLPSFSNVVQHKRWYHTVDYLRILGKSTSNDYYLGKFRLEFFRRNKFVLFSFHRMLRLYYRFVSWLSSILFLEYEWCWKKEYVDEVDKK